MIRMSSLLSFAIFTFLLVGCASYSEIVDDDVYVIGSGVLPVGESMTDETSYAHYRNGRLNDQDWDYFDDRGVFYQTPYPYYSPLNTMVFYPAWNSWNFHYGNPFCYAYGWDFYYTSCWNPYYGMYMPYSVGCYPYGYGFGYTNFYSPYYFGSTPYNGAPIPSQPTNTLTNHHNGPRGSWVSNVNPINRPQTFTGVLKSSTTKPRPTDIRTGKNEFKRQYTNRPFEPTKVRPESPLIHSEKLNSRNTNPVNTQGRPTYPVNSRTQQKFPSDNHRPIRYDGGGNNPVNRQAPASRPSRPNPTPGRRL